MMKARMQRPNQTTFLKSTWPVPDLTTQQNAAETQFDKGVPTNMPLGFECVCIVCSKSWGLMCVHQTAPDSFTPGASGVCVCVRLHRVFEQCDVFFANTCSCSL